uniref:Uncharacterized protein n=1 Tax=Arundo donax TaxID=35708 RepID=A0A0A9D9T9_ARUDO
MHNDLHHCTCHQNSDLLLVHSDHVQHHNKYLCYQHNAHHRIDHHHNG